LDTLSEDYSKAFPRFPRFFSSHLRKHVHIRCLCTL